ncbi:efflux transporter outer membrane subunit [Sphingomonas quercus]|uniref:TolC family protein n=1 Tax=Sphingomonas quercus TaxID=2842451 RepID=A0ABS6BJP1_9SPHN|nr:TolC family protein [Sphingomonas quercus]MBU3078528.1 TolC family protein [Sphingomonas quercus]
MKLALLFPTVSALALAACAAGPDYVASTPSARAAAPFVSAEPAVADAASPAAEQWWRLYNDPVLDGLVQDALAANTDLRVAIARLDRARAALREVRSDRLPSTSVGASTNYGRLPQQQRQPGADVEDWQVDAGLSVAYEVDLFGRVRRNIEAARGDLAATQADTDAVRVAVVAETTRAYADAASAAERLEVAQNVVDLLDQSVTLTGKRFEAGRATRLDVTRIAALRDQRRAAIPPLQADRQAALFRLATLTGRAPQDLPATASARTTIPLVAQPIPVGDGAALLARRPDVRAAERRLAANTARIGVATAALYPRISLGGSIGSTGAGFGDFLGGGPLRWLLGPLISWNFPNQEVARARIAAAEADTRGALASFDGTVLRALQETETALSAYARAIDRQAALTSARDEAATSVRIVRARQREGTVDFLDVLDAERTFADTQADLAAADARITSAQIDLFRALGGGWQAQSGQTAERSNPTHPLG